MQAQFRMVQSVDQTFFTQSLPSQQGLGLRSLGDAVLLGRYKELRYVNVSNNELTSLEPACSALPMLHALNAQFNRLTGKSRGATCRLLV